MKRFINIILALINTPRPTAKYTCSQAELYSGLTSVWDSYALYEADFMAENTKWTAGLATTRKAAIEAAKALPDGQARYEESETLRIDLVGLLENDLEKWNSLDGYIKHAWKGAYYKPKVEAAGKQYYETAANADWEDVALLMQAGSNFITTHEAVLLADGGMPNTFKAAFNAEKTAFDAKYAAYKTARESAQEQTDAKLNANNAIWADGQEVMDDGKHIFRKNASVKERFTWERVLSMITPAAGPAGDTTAVREGDVAMGEIVDIETESFNTTDETMVIVEVGGNALNFSAAPATGPTMGPVVWTVAPGTETKTRDQFIALVGATGANHHLKAQNGVGPGVAHYKITFTKLA